MSKVMYSIVENELVLNGETTVTYGIAVCSFGSGVRQEETVNDVSTDRERLCALVDLCNRLALEPLHLHDVIEDFLAGGI